MIGLFGYDIEHIAVEISLSATRAACRAALVLTKRLEESALLKLKFHYICKKSNISTLWHKRSICLRARF